VETRTCANCGVPLATGVLFCSRCGAAVQSGGAEFPTGLEDSSAGLPPIIPAPTGVPGRPEAGTEPGQAPPAKGPWRMLVALLVVLVLISAGTVAAIVLTRGSSSVSLPQTIGGHPRVTSSALRGLADGVAKQAAIGSQQPRVAFYGTESRPAFMVMAYGFSVPEPTSAFSGATGAFERSSGGSVDVSSLETVRRDGALFQCAPYIISNVQGFLCMWSDSDTFGVVGTFNRSESGIAVVSAVHDAVVQ